MKSGTTNSCGLPGVGATQPSFHSVCWSDEVQRFAQTGQISAELWQEILWFIARRALSRARSYLPGDQWEAPYRRLPWWLIKKKLDLKNTNFPEGVDEDVERFADGVKEVFGKLRRALEGPSGFRKLANN